MYQYSCIFIFIVLSMHLWAFLHLSYFCMSLFEFDFVIILNISNNTRIRGKALYLLLLQHTLIKLAYNNRLF